MIAVSDESLLARIEALVQEEHSLRSREAADATRGDDLSDDRSRLDQVTVELDRCWDLLRQRRALRDAGQDPREAHVRDGEIVEKYIQ